MQIMKETLCSILDVYKDEFQLYKLYINESKLEFLKRPFVSDVAVAKKELAELKNSISERWLVKDEKGKYKHSIKNEMSSFHPS